MITAIVDYGAGNLHSAKKAFQRMSAECGAGAAVVTREPEEIADADRIVLPGDGAFPHCRASLFDRPGIVQAMNEAVIGRGRPFLGICVGMQLMAEWGREYEDTEGLGWIAGEVVLIAPGDQALKVPHMGWNDLVMDRPHPVTSGVESGSHAYFIHSYRYCADRPEHRIAHTHHGMDIAAIVAQDNLIGMQFHPEKSQWAGLRMIANFLNWKP